MFFMKMAELTRAKKLKPGASIPGNNTYFLCKYLKDTMLQAKTYLLCAVRPEAAYLKYTFSTLGFARNASCVRLNPKKATTAASAAERRLMAELEKYKKMVAELRAAASSASPEEVARLQAQLLESQTALQSAVNDGGEEAAARAAEQKKKETDELIVVVGQESVVAEEEGAKAAIEEAEVAEIAKGVAEFQESANKDLAAAEPAIEKAMAALGGLNKNALGEPRASARRPPRCST